MKIFLSRILLVIILPIVDYYVFKKLQILFPKLLKSKKSRLIYWLVSFLAVGFLLVFSLIHNYHFRDKYWAVFTSIVGIIVVVFSPKIIAVFIFLLRDIAKIFFKKNLNYINYITKITLIFLTLFIEFLIFKGIFFERFDYDVVEYNLNYEKLPKEFHNYRIVHLSDFHLGSFRHHKNQLKKIVEISNSLKPDLIVFTGDLVNNMTSEAWDFYEILNQLEAKDGILAVTGNHDYGTYVSWDNDSMLINTFSELNYFYDSLGAELLLNRNFQIKRNNESIYIAGIESSGKPPFDELGDLDQAMENISEDDFVILLSHDPSYWQSKIINYQNIDLTLSGHTHSMQVGFFSDFLDFKWSPVKYIYPEWHGLYKHDNQKLIINNGAGYIAMPLRIGAKPEIGLIILNRDKKRADN